MSLRLNDILNAFVKLGEFLASAPPELEEFLISAKVHNAWFTPENSRQAIDAIVNNYLAEQHLRNWLEPYGWSGDRVVDPSSIGVVAAGNLPLVAFHDILSVLMTGNKLMLKLSAKDNILLAYVLDRLTAIEPALKDNIQIIERLTGFDAVIATGNNNSARYFEFYFGKVPNIIRKNRNSVAVLTGEESTEELKGLASDVFSYFGLGCRNVSKLYVPADYDLDLLTDVFEEYRFVMDHHPYRNNLDYNRTILLMNNIPFQDIDFINVTHNPSIASPIANLHYEYYTGKEELSELILFNRNQIQCIVGNGADLCTIGFGDAQKPGLSDYADDVDVLQFLADLEN